jgi:putative transposase
VVAMTTRYNNKYRIESARAPWWNYASAGAYFITICTNNRKHYFGEIMNGEMQPTQTGSIAEKCWYEITDHAQNIELGEFVVMPNHIHGILKLCGNVFQYNSVRDNVETRHASSLQQKQQCHPKKNSVSSIIGCLEMAWQSRFHDHIIRNDQEYGRIANYIKSNPGNWPADRFFGNGNSGI